MLGRGSAAGTGTGPGVKVAGTGVDAVGARLSLPGVGARVEALDKLCPQESQKRANSLSSVPQSEHTSIKGAPQASQKRATSRLT